MRRTHTLFFAGPDPCRLVLSLEFDARLTFGCLRTAESLSRGEAGVTERGHRWLDCYIDSSVLSQVLTWTMGRDGGDLKSHD